MLFWKWVLLDFIHRGNNFRFFMQIYELVVNKVAEFFGNFFKYSCDFLKQIDWCINSFQSNLVISCYVGGRR